MESGRSNAVWDSNQDCCAANVHRLRDWRSRNKKNFVLLDFNVEESGLVEEMWLRETPET
jgi:hypothetical protein